MIWIKLHNETGVPTRINVAHILRYSRVNFQDFGLTNHEGSSIKMTTDDGRIFVKETPEQIDKMISDAMP